DISGIEPLFAALVGGGLMGLGILSLFRHKASVGGINILALYLQDNFGIRAGWFQLGVDAVILVFAFFVLPVDRVLYSIIGAVMLNLIIGLNHRPGRYIGFSWPPVPPTCARCSCCAPCRSWPREWPVSTAPCRSHTRHRSRACRARPLH